MKVICIDAKNKDGALQGSLLVEGNIYTVICSRICFHGLFKGHLVYDLLEVFPDTKQFLASRFVPLSSIDETELIKERELQLIELTSPPPHKQGNKIETL